MSWISAKELNVEQPVLRATACLIAASLVVAVAIATNGVVAKTFNGLGGILWFASAVLLVRSLRSHERFSAWFAFVFADCLILVILLKPTDLFWALIGFGFGGALVAVVTGAQALNWAPLLPAIWLPTHLLVAMTRAVIRSIDGSEASVRSDPPPTAALVPFAMVVAALVGAFLVDWARKRTLTKSAEQNVAN